jgi:hypothetical protein
MALRGLARAGLARLAHALALAGLREPGAPVPPTGRLTTSLTDSPCHPLGGPGGPFSRSSNRCIMIHKLHRAAALRRRPAAVPVRLRASLLLFLVAFGIAAAPARASGPYVVDDAAITPPGEGQIETWVSLTGRGHVFNFLPATTFEALPFMEWTIGLDTSRFDGKRTTGLTLQGKALFGAEPEAAGEVGFAAAGAVRFGLDGDGAADFAFNGIATIAATDQLLLHGNLGWTRDRLGRTSAMSWGARAEAAVIPERLAIHGEVFGTSKSRAGFQLGLRPTIFDGAMDLELVFSRNLGDQRESWATLGLALRF